MQWLLPDLGVLFLFLLLPVFSLWLYGVIEVGKSRFKNPSDKLNWVLLLLLVPPVGAILYFVVGRKNRIKSI